MRNVTFLKPDNLLEVSRVLIEQKGTAQLAAGCTDVIPALRRELIDPQTIISLRGIPNLSYIVEDGSVVRIGATTIMTQIAMSALIQSQFPALAEAAANVGSRLVQNSATLAGNLCNASPAADTAPPLLVYGAKVKIFNQGTEREVELAQFFVGPRRTILQPGDVVVEIILPRPESNSYSVFIKQGRRKALEISILTVAVKLVLGNNGEVVKAAIACGAVGPTPVLVKASEKLLGRAINSEADLVPMLEALTAEVSPISDIRGTAEYRQHMVGILAKRAVCQLVTSCGRGA